MPNVIELHGGIQIHLMDGTTLSTSAAILVNGGILYVSDQGQRYIPNHNIDFILAPQKRWIGS